ncbi:uncharacterized protein VTP21DRAFT_5594 [Calcarisporiella thermophila]|uniref:uncharacterized protein n=1 Tax=Calcarisporiella thermophila TaxID=911321 RepID=UPI0037447EAB
MMETSSAPLDMALDDIVKQDKTQKRQRRDGGGVRNSGRGSRRQARSSPYQRPKKADAQAGSGNQQPRVPDRITVENLFYEITNDDLKELFSQIGPLKKCQIRFDRSGRSTGIADLIFENPYDAAEAYKQYDGVTLDGQPMKITILAPSERVYVERRSKGEGNSRSGIFSRLGSREDKSSGRGAGRRGKSGGRREKPTQKKPATAEELDAQLDQYMQIDNSKADA